MSCTLSPREYAQSKQRGKTSELLGLLRTEAACVETETGTDLAALRSAGFDEVKTDRTQIALPKPVI